jgi:hypothetical protein
MSIVLVIQWRVVECIVSTHLNQHVIVSVLAILEQTGVFLVGWGGSEVIVLLTVQVLVVLLQTLVLSKLVNHILEVLVEDALTILLPMDEKVFAALI